METDTARSDKTFPPMLLDLMESCGARTSPAEFIRKVSNTYHEIEAPLYDGIHKEIATQVTPHLHDFASLIADWYAGRAVRVLDVGCGTGFASSTLLQARSPEIASLVLSDISPHMLGICRTKFHARPNLQFVEGDIEHLSRTFPPFDVVMTCSVIHHVGDLGSFFASLRKLLVPGGAYMMLHEPSRRFYANSNCIRFFEGYQKSRRRRNKLRYLNPARYLHRAVRVLRHSSTSSLESKASELLVKRNIIQQPLTRGAIRQLVDIHVPPIHSDPFDMGSRGFDISMLSAMYLPGFIPMCTRTYGFLGTEFEGVAGKRWQARARRLALLYPADGAQFSVLWRRADTSPQRED